MANTPATNPRPLAGGRYSWLIAATVAVSVTLLAVGLYGTWSQHDKVVSTVTLVLSFAGFGLSVLQAWPGIIRHTTGAWKILSYGAVMTFLASSGPAIFLVVQQPVIRIGVSLPLSGPDQPDGESMLQAVRMAIADESSDRIDNYRIEPTVFDDADVGNKVELYTDEGADTGRSEQFTDVVDDVHLAGIVGPFNSGAALVEIPATGAAGVAQISPATTLGCLTAEPKCHGETMRQPGSYLRLAATDRTRAMALVAALKREKVNGEPLATDRPGPAQAVVFSDKSSFGDGFADAFVKAWRAAYPKRTAPLAPIPIAQGIADAGHQKKIPPIVLFAGTGSDGSALYSDIQQNKNVSRVTFVAAATIMNVAFTNGVPAKRKGPIYAVTPFPYDKDGPIAAGFRSRYRSANKQDSREPTPYAVAAYDATRVLIQSIRTAVSAGHRPPVVGFGPVTAGKTRALRAGVLQNLHEINRPSGIQYTTGILGTFSFTENGDATYDAVIDPADSVSVYRYAGGPTSEWDLVR
jgi:ABC-type branched-subunit amino acid transport system substrate-binding protein